jgi:hypothetical protein
MPRSPRRRPGPLPGQQHPAVLVLPPQRQPGCVGGLSVRRSGATGCRPAPAARRVPGARTAAAPAASRAWPGCWPAPASRRRCAVGQAGVQPDVVGRGVGLRGVSRPRDRCRPRRSVGRSEQRGADGQDAGAAAVVQHAAPAGHAAGRLDAIQRRHMRVVGWVPVPKAMPGSSRITCGRRPGGSCQLGTIQNSGVIGTGSNCALRQPHPVLVGHRPAACTRRPAVQSCASSRVARPRPGRSLEQRTQVERFQPARRRHAGFAEQRLLGVGVGVGVLHRHRQRVEFVASARR